MSGVIELLVWINWDILKYTQEILGYFNIEWNMDKPNGWVKLTQNMVKFDPKMG